MKSSKHLACALLVAATGANAQVSPNMGMPKPASVPAATAAASLTDGVVQGVDLGGITSGPRR